MLSSSASKSYQVLCDKSDMIKLSMVRGAARKIFYARCVGKTDKVYMVNQDKPGEIENKECFQLTTGRMVCFEPDSDNTQTKYERNFKGFI